MSIHISVVLPVFNNEGQVQSLAELLVQELTNASHTFELIFVDDASTDQSYRKLKEIQVDNEQMVLIRHPTNRGQHRAVLNGIRRAKGDYLVVMDADLQDQPSVIPELIESLKNGADAAFVLREGQYQHRMRMITSFLFKGLLFAFTGLHPKAGSFFALSRDTYRKLAASNNRFLYISVIAHHFASEISYVHGKRLFNPENQSSYSFFSRSKFASIAMLTKAELILRQMGE